MKFTYSNRLLLTNLIMGLVWLGLGVRYLFNHETIGFKPFTFIGVGILFIILFIYQYVNKYFQVTDEWIKISSLLDKKIKISELIKVEFNSGIYVFTSPSKKFRIMQTKIKRVEIEKFNELFDKIKAKVDNKK